MAKMILRLWELHPLSEDDLLLGCSVEDDEDFVAGYDNIADVPVTAPKMCW